MKSIALICPSTDGHHETYLRQMTRVLTQCGHAVTAITPDANRLRQWIDTQHAAISGKVQVHELNHVKQFRLPGALSIWSDKMDWVRFSAQRIQNLGIKPDLVFHTWLDNCLTPGMSASLTDLLFPFQWSGLYFHPWYLRHAPRLNLRYASLRRGVLTNHAALNSRRCPAVAILDEGIRDKLQRLINNKPVIIFPDIANDADPEADYPLAVEIKRCAAGRKIISLLGMMNKRKGMLMLMETAQRAAQEDWFFVFAGPYQADTFTKQEHQQLVSFIASAPENCLFHFEHVPDGAAFNALVAVSDILFAVYLGFYSSSNLLTKAALFSIPVLVSDAALMGERVRAYHLGMAIDETSTEQCIAALRQLTQTNDLPVPRYGEYARLHSIEQLTVSMKTLLAAAGIT